MIEVRGRRSEVPVFIAEAIVRCKGYHVLYQLAWALGESTIAIGDLTLTSQLLTLFILKVKIAQACQNLVKNAVTSNMKSGSLPKKDFL
ncbi:hypothetical protein ABN584_12795 [Gloeocapsa sp. BRSZ]